MKLKKLIQDLPIQLYSGSKEVSITGLCSHSKRVAPGNLFIAKSGHTDLGALHIDEAVSAGAAAILSDMGNPFLKECVQLVHPHPSEVEGKLAAAFYGASAKELLTIGVTGTSGKTSTTYLIKHLLDSLALPCGLIGTVEYCVGGTRYPASLTTPDVITNHKLLKEMCLQGMRGVAMEVSSHGLDQGRVAEIPFQVGVFTNLSHEHLDYHHTMEAYSAAKGRLFEVSKLAIVNADSPWTEQVLKKSGCPRLTFGFSEKADFAIETCTLSFEKTRFALKYRGDHQLFETTLLGRHSALNCTAAIAVLASQGVPLASLVEPLAAFPGVPGRLERVKTRPIFIDYAHKPDALENALSTLKEVALGKVIVVFGCGGDRDRTKRPQMASISERLADFTIVTSDNPRSEDPAAICDEIARGFGEKRFLIEPDRRAAIAKALERAGPQDLILIAGKGHEKVQIFAHQTIPFDDYAIAEELSN